MMGQFPHINWSACLPGLALLSPSNNQSLLDISRAPSSQPINMKNWWLFYYAMAFPAAIGRELGLVVWSRIKDMFNLQKSKICIHNCLPSSCGPSHIHISLSNLDIPIQVIYICWDLHVSHSAVQKIKIKHSCYYLAVFSFDMEWWFFDTNLFIKTTLYLP